MTKQRSFKKALCAVFLLLCLIMGLTGCNIFSPQQPTPNDPPSKGDPNTIYADEFFFTNAKEVTVPIKIKNNTGISGFEILFKYDESILAPTSAAPTAALSGGTFNDSIATAQDNSFSVIWAGSDNVTADGQIFLIKFQILSESATQTPLQVSFIQENTINEDIEEVALSCKTITINLKK